MVQIDKVRAVVYGQAIGDALGLPVEFKSAKAIRSLVAGWEDEWPKAYRRTSRKGNLEVWKAGEWSDDTEMALCILDAFLQGVKEGRSPKEHPDLLIVADQFVKWAQTNGRGMGNHTWKCLQDALFLLDPRAVAHEVWEASGRQAAPNGAVMRTAYVGVLRPWDLDWTAEAAAECAATTHADPRCVASAVAVSVAVAALVTGQDVHAAVGHAVVFGGRHDPNVKDWVTKGLDELRLDEGLDDPRSERMPPIGFTYKAMGAGFHALLLAVPVKGVRASPRERFRRSLEAVIMAGGDADTNGAVAGALLGAYLGMDGLPEVLVRGLEPRAELDRRLVRLIATYE